MDEASFLRARTAAGLCALLLSAGPSAACDSASDRMDEPEGAPVAGASSELDCGDFALDYLAPTCTFVVCHDGQSGNALDLVAPGLPQRLIGVKSGSLMCGGRLYIDPVAPEQSLLLRKLDPEPPCGDRMPPAAMATAAERACLSAWISAAVATWTRGEGL